MCRGVLLSMESESSPLRALTHLLRHATSILKRLRSMNAMRDRRKTLDFIHLLRMCKLRLTAPVQRVSARRLTWSTRLTSDDLVNVSGARTSTNLIYSWASPHLRELRHTRKRPPEMKLSMIEHRKRSHEPIRFLSGMGRITAIQNEFLHNEKNIAK